LTKDERFADADPPVEVLRRLAVGLRAGAALGMENGRCDGLGRFRREERRKVVVEGGADLSRLGA
jgi:hypothetical protein